MAHRFVGGLGIRRIVCGCRAVGEFRVLILVRVFCSPSRFARDLGFGIWDLEFCFA